MNKVSPISPNTGERFPSEEKSFFRHRQVHSTATKENKKNTQMPLSKPPSLHQISTNQTPERTEQQENPVKDILGQGEEDSSNHTMNNTHSNSIHNFEGSMVGLKRQFFSDKQLEKNEEIEDNRYDEFTQEKVRKSVAKNSAAQDKDEKEIKNNHAQSAKRKEDNLKKPKELDPNFKKLLKRKRSDSWQIKESKSYQRNLSKSTFKHSLMSMSKQPDEDQSQDTRQKRRKDVKNIQYILSMSRSDLNGQPNNTSGIYKKKENKTQGKSAWQILGVLETVKTFIENLKNLSTFTYGFSNVNKKHLELIDDLAVVYENPGLSNYLGTFIGGLLSKIPIFSPDSLVIIIWNLLLNIQILVQFVMIPLKICFFLEFNSSLIEIIFFYTPTVIFSMEIFVRLNISYYFEGVLIKDRRKIIAHYLFKTYYFWIDLVTTLTFLFSKDINHPLLIFVVLFRFFQFSQLVREIDEHFQISQRFPSAWNLTSLFLIILLLAHFTGCGFHYIAFIQSEAGQYTWLDKANIYDADWKIQFIYSIYWSSITMITVGYGDIVPITSAEKIYVIIMTLISAGVFAYSINTIGSIFTEHSKKQEALKQKNNQTLFNEIKKHDISIYMRNRNISGQLQIETIKYLDYINQEEMEATKRGQGVIQLLSDSIKEKLQADFYGRIIQESSIFSNYSQPCIQEITQSMKEQLYGPGELIFSQGDLDTRLFFIVKGQVQLFIPRKKKNQPIIISTLEKGEVGHNGFFADQPRGTSFKSLNVSQTVIINKEDFLRILLKYPQDQERFCVVKDSIQQNLQKQKFNCFACGVAGHTIITCQRIHFKKSKWFTIQKFNFSQDQLRVKHERKRDSKENTFSNHDYMRYCLIKLRGQKMAEISQIVFDQEGADWLREQKDKTIFQLIPRLVYENNQFTLGTDSSEGSDLSQSPYGGMEDSVSDRGSNPEQSVLQTERNSEEKHMYSHSISIEKESPTQPEKQQVFLRNPLMQRESSLVLKPSRFQQQKKSFKETKVDLNEQNSLSISNGLDENQEEKTNIQQNNQQDKELNAKIIQTKNKLFLLQEQSNQLQSTSSHTKLMVEEISENKDSDGFQKIRNKSQTTPSLGQQFNCHLSEKQGKSYNNSSVNANKRTSILLLPQEKISPKNEKQLLSSNSEDSESSDESTSHQRGQLFSIFTKDGSNMMKEDENKEIDPKTALDIPSPLTGPSNEFSKGNDKYASPPGGRDNPQRNKQRKSNQSASLANYLKLDLGHNNVANPTSDNAAEQLNLKSQIDDKAKEFMSSVIEDSVKNNNNNSNNGDSKQFDDYHSLSQSQRIQMLKQNGGSFKNVMQKKQELQTHFKHKQIEKQQELLQINGYQNLAIQKQLSRILEVPIDKLTPLKLTKIEAPPGTPLKTLRHQTFSGFFKTPKIDFDQQGSINTVVHQNSKQMNNQNSLVSSPPKIITKEFLTQLPVSQNPIISGIKQIEKLTSQLPRNSISLQPSQQQQQIIGEKSPESRKHHAETPKQFMIASTQLGGKSQIYEVWSDFLCLENIDCMKNYEIYFPDQNCALVLKGYSAYRQKRLLQQRKYHKKKKPSNLSSPSHQNKKHSKFFTLVTTKLNMKKTRTLKGSDLTDS